MPHSHSTTEAATRRIEDTIEQLLCRGQQISSKLRKEMNYAGKLHRERISCSRSTSRATGLDKNQGSRSQMTVVVSSCSQIGQKRDENPCQKNVPSVVYQTKKGGDRSEKSQWSFLPSQKKEEISRKTPRLPISSCLSPIQTSSSSKDRKVVKKPKVCSRPKKESCSSQSRVKNQKKPVSPSEMSSCSYSTFTTKKQKVFSSGQEKGQSVNPTSSRGEWSRSEKSFTKKARSIVSEYFFDHVQDTEKVESNFKSYPDDWARIYQNKTTHGTDEILTRAYSPKDPNSKWIRVNEVWKSQQGRQVLNLWLDLLGEKCRNIWVNDKQISI